jgi:hypothetical protein
MTTTNRIIEIYNRNINDEKFCLQKIQIPNEKYYYIRDFEFINEEFALYDMYVQHDYDMARKHFYKAAVTGEYMVRKYDVLMHTQIYKICQALLSDNNKVIESYMVLKNSKWSETFLGYQFNTAIQSILKDDYEMLNRQIIGLKKSVTKTKPTGAKAFAGCVNVFEGILNKDKDEIEVGINELIKTKGKRDELLLFKDFFSIETTALAKLAWRKGYEIKVESSFVPIEILPIKELEEYPGYDFFKEIGY